jgi:hypothetical protein
MQLEGGAQQRTGSRRQVMNGTAEKTTGGLKKEDLTMNKWGHIVSKKASKAAKKNKNLSNAGFTAKKGEFGAFKNGKKVKGAKRFSKK